MDNTLVDINCDVGEGMDNEADLMPLISSCSIACGGHTGDMESMWKTVVLAKRHKVRIGAHPSYPDRENFGRVSMVIPEKDLVATLQEQIDALVSILRKENTKLHHIKPHGALYNDLTKNTRLASIFLKALEKYGQETHLYVPYTSAISEIAKRKGVSINHEAFGDRRYHKDLQLVSRKRAESLIQNPKKVLEQVLMIKKRGQVNTLEKETVKILADTVCIHGDTPSAFQIVSYLSRELPKHGVQIRR